MDAFDLADKYTNPAMILGDGLLGQMMEAVEFKERPKVELPDKSGWALTGCKGREHHYVVSFDLDPNILEKWNLNINEKYKKLKEKEVRYEAVNLENADLVIVAYGTVARIAKTTIQMAKKEGLNIGLMKLAVNGKAEVNFYGRSGGIIPSPEEILKEAKKYL
jgi:2-oxoglutarate ferredoxin oxidoreductase subunit alpha